MKNGQTFSGKGAAVLASLIFFAAWGCTDSSSSPDPLQPVDVTALAQCLTSKGAVMYGSSSCGYTLRQMAAFGDDFRHIQYVECTEAVGRCRDAGIEAYPTWVIDGRRYRGWRDLVSLARLADCSYMD